MGDRHTAAVDTATVAVISSSVIALASIAATAFQHERRLSLDRALKDLEAVRGALDDAAAALHRTAYVLDDVRSQVTQHAPAFAKTEKGTEVFAKLGQHGNELDALTERLSVRFGRKHDVVSTFRTATEAALAIYRAVGRARLEPDADESPAAVRAVQDFHDETRATLALQRTSFDDARRAFIDAAHGAAGAALG